MIELRWFGKELQVRQRSFQQEASGALCGVTDFGKWETVQQKREMPKFVAAARDVVSAFEEHGVGPEFPELQSAIESMKLAFENSIWNREIGE